MKKRFLGLALTGFLAFSLTACSGGNNNAQTSAQQSMDESMQQSGKEETESSQTGDKDMVEIAYACWDAGQAKLLKTVAEEFEKENPGIRIDIQVSGWNEYWTGLEAAATGGSLPDTFWMHSNNIYYYASNDQLLDLTPYIEKSELVDLGNYPEGLVDIYSLEGKQYAIPKDYDTIGLWYNKTVFDEAGLSYPDETWTWKDLKEAAKKLTAEDKSRYGMCAGLHNQEGFYNFIYQNGGSVIDDNMKSGYANPETIGGVDEYFSFVREGLSPEIYDDKARAEAIQNGQCAMGLFGSWNLSGFAANDFMKENFDCAVLPMSNEGGKASIFNGLGNAVAVNTKHPEEAWKWVEYLSSEMGQKRQAELGVAISAYKGTADAWLAAYPDFNVKAYIDMIDYAQIRPYSHQTSVWEDKVNEILKDAYSGKTDTKSACEKAAAAMDEAIAAEQ